MSNNSGEQGCAFYQGHHRSASLEFSFSMYFAWFCVAFILFVNTRCRRKDSKAETSRRADPLALLQRGSAVLAPRCHCGAGQMQLWFGSIRRSWDHCRGETASPSAAGALGRKEGSVGRTGRNRDLLRRSPHTNVSPGQPQPN